MSAPVQFETPARECERGAPKFLRRLLDRIFARSENFVAGRHWALEVLFLAILFTVLFSGGVDDDRLSLATNNRWAGAYFQKIEHPLLDVAKINPPESHEAKQNFRLTVPVILHLLRVSPNQRWILPMLCACGTCVLILLSCLFAFRVTGDRVCGLYAALATSSTYIGSFGFMMYYDTIALSQIALAMLPGTPWFFKGLLVFTAGFTDERAIPASLFLLVQALSSPPQVQTIRQRIMRLDFLGVLAGIAAYFVARLALQKFAGLTSPHEGIGLDQFVLNAPFWHAGAWLALKGGWLLVTVAAICLWQRRQIPALVAFACLIVLCVGSGFLVQDVLRSTSYVFPALLVALGVAATCETTRSMRIYCLAAFAISAITGNYNVWLGQITWLQPVAVRIFHSILHAIFHTSS